MDSPVYTSSKSMRTSTNSLKALGVMEAKSSYTSSTPPSRVLLSVYDDVVNDFEYLNCLVRQPFSRTPKFPAVPLHFPLNYHTIHAPPTR